MRFLSGIAGFVGHGEDRNQLEKMVEVLTHRGPDDTGLRVAPGIGLDLRRLAIIDPAGGRHPMTNREWGPRA